MGQRMAAFRFSASTGRTGVLDCGHFAKTRAFPVASMATQRLRVCAVGSICIPGGHGDQVQLRMSFLFSYSASRIIVPWKCFWPGRMLCLALRFQDGIEATFAFERKPFGSWLHQWLRTSLSTRRPGAIFMCGRVHCMGAPSDAVQLQECRPGGSGDCGYRSLAPDAGSEWYLLLAAMRRSMVAGVPDVLSSLLGLAILVLSGVPGRTHAVGLPVGRAPVVPRYWRTSSPGSNTAAAIDGSANDAHDRPCWRHCDQYRCAMISTSRHQCEGHTHTRAYGVFYPLSLTRVRQASMTLFTCCRVCKFHSALSRLACFAIIASSVDR